VTPAWIDSSLRLPLQVKLFGANLSVLLIALFALWSPSIGHGPLHAGYSYVILAALAGGCMANFWLVRLALHPVTEMQKVAEKVVGGEFDSRVSPSPLADPKLRQLELTFNAALECLAEAQENTRLKGAGIVYGQERERAEVARELHDSIGQILAAAAFQASAAEAEGGAAANAESSSIGEVRRLIHTALEEIRNMSRALHPRVADDLGLPAAIESLARSTMDRSLIGVTVSANGLRGPVPQAVASTIYRISAETLRDIEKNGLAGDVTVALTSRNATIELDISGHSAAFSGCEVARLQASLAEMGRRISLLGGELTVGSNLSGGIRVTAMMKIEAEAA